MKRDGGVLFFFGTKYSFPKDVRATGWSPEVPPKAGLPHGFGDSPAKAGLSYRPGKDDVKRDVCPTNRKHFHGSL